MANPKLGKTPDGRPMHYSVGAIIKQDGKYLLLDRKNPPPGYACLAGHIDEGETPEQAILREIPEESGLEVISVKLLFEELLDGEDYACKRGIQPHYWYVYSAETKGNIKIDEKESKSLNWYTPEQLKTLKLERCWKKFFKELKII